MTAQASHPVAGRCICGACRFTGNAVRMTTSVCHCETCRRWAGGTLFSVDLADSLKVNDDAPLHCYATSPHMDRYCCDTCNAPLYRHSTEDNRFYAVMEALDNPGDFRFDLQIFIDEKPANYDFANDTVTMTGAQFMTALEDAAAKGNG